MFYIFFKLENKKQLIQLYPTPLEELEKRAAELIHSCGGSRLVDEGDIFQFAALYRETAIYVMECAESLKSLLDEYRQYLCGFSIIISSGHEQDDLVQHFHNLSLTTSEENCIWMEDSVRDKFSDYLEPAKREEYSQLFPVQIKVDKLLSIEERYRRFIKREDLIPSLQNDINQWLYRQDESPGMVMTSNSQEETLNILRTILDDSHHLIENFLLIEPAEDFWDPWYPLCHFINKDFLPHVEQYLSGDDKLVWKEDKIFLENISRGDWYLHYYDQIEIDFLKAVVLYWRGCLKKLDTYPTPPVLIIRNPGLFSENSKILISHFVALLKESFPRQKFLLLTGDSDGPLPEGLDDNFRKRSIPPMADEDVRLKAADVFPELKLSPDELIKAYKAEGRRLMSLFYFLQNRLEAIQHTRTDLSSPGAYLFGRDKCSIEILSLCFPGRYCLTRSQVIEFFHSRGISLPEIEERLKRFENLGYLRFLGTTGGLWCRPLELAVLEETPGFDGEELTEDFIRFLSREMEDGKIGSLSGLFYYLNQKGSIDFGLDILNRIIHHLLKIRENDLAEDLLNSPLFENRTLTFSQQEGLHNIQYAGRLRSALLRNSKEEISVKLDAGYLSLMEAQGACSEEFLLQQAHYHALNGDSELAQTTVKASLFAFQKNSDHYGEIRANTALALTMLSQRKLSASLDYFEIALRISEQLRDKEAALISGKLMVLSSYLYGNLSLALRSLERHIPLAQKERNRETQIFQLFLKGRILFELGRYSEAFKTLKLGRRLSKRYFLTKESHVITSWMARSLCFGHNEKIADELLSRQSSNLETAYFRAEAAYMSGDKKIGISYLEEAFREYDQNPLYIHEMDSWLDGYRVIEGRLSDKDFYEDVLLDQARGFYYLLIGLNGEPEKAWEGLAPLCRMDRAYNQQPFGYYFFLYAAEIIEQTGIVVSETHQSLVSHAFKLLQTRAGRFDSQQMKHNFFRKNYWNNEIVLKAQELNLI
ncbi:hypothetical protein EXM22_08645 [Oceanispirochaeta crateris]|uniref:MalT-like TPR region domain-containing protein n=1 Tax=Oceanispirochaeta crateris TaxID=2518645 RepID=A0A5C1QLF7_9SPIO|nr:hypothetical protein [Oceanispirochaeta crateris]QEN08049.1 hypothetical protein EXM22_08645 [Oceanispirochaeta crateris]